MEPGVTVATVSLLVSVAVFVRGEVRAHRTDGRAERAEQRAQRAEVQAVGAEAKAEELRLAQLWSDVVKQVQRWLNVNVLAVSLAQPLTDLRTAAVELVDAAPRDEWPGLDAWLNAEHVNGSLLGRATLERLGPDAPSDADTILAAHEDLHLWAHALLSNVRRLRNLGPGEESRRALPKLTAEAERRIAAVCERHGWEIPRQPDRIKPIADVQDPAA